MEENVRTVLLIDDSPVALKSLRTILELRPGWTVVAEAENGTDGLALFYKTRPTVVIVDFQMPGLNGLEVGREIRLSDPKVLLILFTLHDSKQIEELAKAAGFDAVVPKTNAFPIAGIVETLNKRTRQAEPVPPTVPDPVPVTEISSPLAIPSVASESLPNDAMGSKRKNPTPAES
jgi:DNA-binding NarL/FixJ family response regulator